MNICIGIPTLNNFKGLAELFQSLWGVEVVPLVVDNWNNNLGVASSWNKMLDYAVEIREEFLIICNDDIIFKPGAVTDLLYGWQTRPSDALLISASSADGSIKVDNFIKGAPDYSCFAFNPQEMLDKVGKFDQNFYPAYFEDNDHHYRIRLAGYEAYQYQGALINHKGSQTQNADPKNPVCTSQMFEKNRDYYAKKWGGIPGNERWNNPFANKDMTLRDW